ncbi:MAG: hypothetical protein JKY37_12900, partial [Nannocystaceae bacterium]|nr:hypothetical protein [Nannocystaceae bacterium]
STRAKALAGLGLCELSAGDEAAANALFASARAADRTVAAFIEQQRAKIEAGSPQSRD